MKAIANQKFSFSEAQKVAGNIINGQWRNWQYNTNQSKTNKQNKLGGRPQLFQYHTGREATDLKLYAT